MNQSRQITHRSPVRISGWCVFLICALLVILMVSSHQSLTYSLHYGEIMAKSTAELGSEIEAGSPGRRVAYIALLIGACIVLFRRRGTGRYVSAVRNNIPLACFVGLTFFSIAWAGDAGLTLRRSIEYLIFCLGTIAAARILGLKRIVWLGFAGSAAYLVLGIACELYLGTFHPLDVDYRFCGTAHPNHQAWNCVLLLLSGSALHSEIHRPWKGLFRLLMLLAVLCLVLTKSRTSLACGCLALLIYWGPRLSIRQKLAGALAFVTLLAILLVPFLALGGGASRLNASLLAGRAQSTYENFSGRIPLWEACMQYVGRRPRLGYGFNGFWTPRHIEEISATQGWTVPVAHNGYIELLLSVGIVGLLLYTYQLGSTWKILRRAYRANPDPFTRFYLVLLIYYCIEMFAEAIGFDLGLPTFCLMAMLWSRKLWFQQPPSSECLEKRESKLESAVV